MRKIVELVRSLNFSATMESAFRLTGYVMEQMTVVMIQMRRVVIIHQ
jgi:hypothetical protein